jgi:predicted GH43/DUF377 family glycosyl hydrolase
VIFERDPANPILTRADVPDVPPHIVDVTSVFNPGAVRYLDRTLLILRVQTRGRETHLFTASSDDGVRFEVSTEPVRLQGIERVSGAVYHVYDPRITRIGPSFYVMVAIDMDGGCRLGVARTDDFETFDFLGVGDAPDIRNGVLFPGKIGERYVRLDRPNTAVLDSGVTSGEAIVLSESDDLVHWREMAQVMRGRLHYWDERIGPGPPPIKTRAGWLLVYHGIATHFAAANIYQAGAVLLDLDDPSKVVGRTRDNILEPREPYELVGQVPNVVFPSGMIVDGEDVDGFAKMDARVRLYYGAADTSIGLATTTVERLVKACDPGSRGDA